MVEIRATKSPAELIALLDAQDDALIFDTSARGLAAMSSRKMLDRQGIAYRFLNARFTGSLPAAHEIGVRAVVDVLGQFQDVLAEIGAAIVDDVPARGQLPESVRSRTELRFSPQVEPGSVVFTLHPPQTEAGLVPSDSLPLLDQSLERLFLLFDSVELPESSGAGPETVVNSLVEFGPRTARHLFLFARALSVDGLSLDLGWTTSGSQLRKSRLSSTGATYLRVLARKATTRDLDVTLRGEILNLGVDNVHKFEDEERGPISIKSDDALTDALHPTFKQSRVEISAKETESINTVTGAVRRTYVAQTVISLTAND